MTKIACVYCGQDYLQWYRNVLNDQRFLLCPEEDSGWLPDEDTSQSPKQSLRDLFADIPLVPPANEWDFIEPTEPPA